MIAVVSQQATDATEAGLLVFAAACLLLAFLIGAWPTIQGLLSLPSDPAEVKWEELSADPEPELYDWSNVDWDELRRAGRERSAA